jgi:hypothetical protein
MGWLSTSIVHYLKNPLGTISAGAENVDGTRSCANRSQSAWPRISAAPLPVCANCWQTLLARALEASQHFQICNIRHIIETVSEAVLPIAERQGVRIVNEASSGLQVPLVRSRM